MISTFLVLSAALLLFATLLIVYPFIKRSHKESLNPNANALRIDSYFARLQELQDEIDNGKLNQKDYDSAVIEQKRLLLNELSPLQQQSIKGSKRTFSLSAALFLVSFCGVFYYVTGNFHLLTQWQQATENLPELGKRAVLQQGEPLSNNEMQQFALGLRTQLAEQGDDEMAWFLLGRIVMQLNDFDMAEQAFQKVLDMNPNNVNALLSYSQALLFEGSESSVTKAAKMLSQVLAIEPSNLDAVSLLALIAYERKDWLEAKTAFELLLSAINESDSRYAMLQQRLQEVESELNKINNLTQNNDGQGRYIDVSIALSSELVDQLPKQSTLFVFAKAVNGPPMPLAVIKKNQYTLPLELRLSDANAMVDGLNLSKFDQVEVIARISLDENVQAQSGEFEARSQMINLENTQSVTLKIDKRL